MFRFADLLGNRSDLDPLRSKRSSRSRFRSLGVEPLEGRRLLAVIPLAPPGQTVTTASYTQATPSAIPSGPAVVTSTLVVSGAGTYLHDVNLTTFLTHTFPGDLDITITSPAGTVVTLTTDNGDTNDDVFNGTVWDDDANPGGQVPYTSNTGMVTDTAYAVGVPQATLTPEEALGAFIGENPNGTWTITISDDTADDAGSLNSWGIEVSTLTAAPDTIDLAFSSSTPVAVSPGAPSVVSSTIVVSGAGSYLFDVNLTTFLRHTFPGDVDMTITSPTGTVVTLTSDNGGTADDVFNGTVWNDDANPAGPVPYTVNNGLVTDTSYVIGVPQATLTSEEPLAAFIGENPNGTWTITISDDTNLDGGTLDSWSLALRTLPPGPQTAVLALDPLNPGSNVLLVTGSEASEAIIVQPVPGNPSQTRVVFPGLFLGPFANSSFGRIEIRARGGSDSIAVDPAITVPAYIYAGAGNDSVVGGSGDDIIYGEGGIDSIVGGAGHDVVFGGDDNDYVYGGLGNDILLGGNGSDWLYGQENEDILLGSRTTFDGNVTAWRSYSQGWSAPTPFADRMLALGASGLVYNRIDDAAADYLMGGVGRDFGIVLPLDFFLDYDPNPTTGDRRLG